MLNDNPLLFHGIVALTALVLYAFVWRVTRELPGLVRLLVRVTAALVILAPIALAVLNSRSSMTSQQEASAPRPADPAAVERARQAAAEAERKAVEDARRAIAEQEQRRKTAEEAARAEAKKADEATPKPQAPAGGAAPTPPAPPPAVTARASKADEQADSHVVPVFFGTDRNQVPGAERVDFGTERGKALLLGRALVTVPKAHQVPNVELPAVYRLPFTQVVLYREREDPARHFTMKEVKALSRDEFLALVRERLGASQSFKDHALVFVHGFNTTFDFAVFRTAQIAYDLKFDGAPFVYSWPSKSDVGAAPYAYDRESATQAEPYFREFLQMVASETGAKHISLIAHSMGNQLALAVLRDIKRSAPPGVEISQIILAAPDVDRDSFEFMAREIQGVGNGITLYAASNDLALDVARRFWGGVPRAGDVPSEGPLVVPGIDTIDVSSTNTEIFSLHHSGYAEKTAILSDIQALIQTGLRPPEKRLPLLQRVETAKGVYWRYPAGQ